MSFDSIRNPHFLQVHRVSGKGGSLVPHCEQFELSFSITKYQSPDCLAPVLKRCTSAESVPCERSDAVVPPSRWLGGEAIVYTAAE